MSHGPSPNLFVSLDQFLDGIISLFITLQFLSNALHFFSVLPFAAAFFAGAFLTSGFLASGLARGFAAAFAVVLAAGFLAGAFFFAVFFFGRGPTVVCLLSVRISVTRSTVISSR